MLSIKSLAAVACTLYSITSVKADDLPAIEIVGNKFFYSNNGSQFYMKGIAYQQDTANITTGESFVDPLADEEACARDVPYLEAVATNTIRVYALNESQDHTACLNLLQEAGIYIIADLSEPGLSIDRSDPKWNVELYNRYTTIVDEFQNYTNILGFFAGNEVTNDNTNTDASAFVKAAIRDTKAYIKAQGYRSIPVGYSSNDDAKIRVPIADYFACGSADERADFFGMNMYEWCGDSTFEESGYEEATKSFGNLSIPIFFSEYGCNEVSPRKFTEVAALYGSDMTDVWSGGIVYMYFEEANNYGLVSIDDGEVSTLEDYSYYQSEILAISPSSAQSSEATTTGEISCPTQFANWKASTDLPPTPDDSLCSCMEQSLTCVVKDSTDEDDYSDIFGYICGEIDCGGITANGTTGEYGAYSFCSSKQQLSFVLNLYYIEQGNSDSACDFDGQAEVVSSAKTEDSCSSALSAAGSSGLGTVSGTVSGTATGTKSGSTATGSGSSSSSSQGGANVASAPTGFLSVVSLISAIGLSVFMI